MLVTSITIKQFRCFLSKSLIFTKPLVIIKGPNGSGKTSLLEALYYACHLRSFRTRVTRELMHFGADAFSIKLQVESTQVENANEYTDITVGYSPRKRIIKINSIPLKSYKELVDIYRVIAITEDDLLLIRGSPEIRRSFLDQAITLIEPEYYTITRRYENILEQRNSLLNQASSFNPDSYAIWTEQLVNTTNIIREKRLSLVEDLSVTVNNLLKDFFSSGIRVQLTYKPKEFPNSISELEKLERLTHHTMFGAHLDDYSIFIANRSSKSYASRGQQKLIAILLKLAQPATKSPQSCIFMLDDVVSDLDNEHLKCLFGLLHSYQTQLIITSPLIQSILPELLSSYNHETIIID